MNKRRKRFDVAGVLLTHVVLMVFVLGFTGCDWIKGVLGMEEDNSNQTPGTPPPEDPKAYLTLYVSDSGSEATDEDADNDGTDKDAPLPTVAAALARVAEAYDVDVGGDWKQKVGEWQETVTAWQKEGSEGGSPPNPGKAISAEIVIVGTTKEVITIPATADTTYPPLILSAQNSVLVDSEADSAGDITLPDDLPDFVLLHTVGYGVTLTLRDITLKGNDDDNRLASLVTVDNGGNLILADNAVIYGHTSDLSPGGGVYVANGGTFTMSGGEIWGNSTDSGGGVCVGDGGTFIMSGGAIQGNSAANMGGGVYMEEFDVGVRFAKTGESVIYGYDNEDNADLNNTSSGNTKGNAAYVYSLLHSDIVEKRNSTVGAGVDLYWPLGGEHSDEDVNWEDPPQP